MRQVVLRASASHVSAKVLPRLQAVTTRLHLPYPPSLWMLYEGHGKRRHESKAYQQWLHDAGWLLKSQQPKQHLGKVAVTYFPTKPDNFRRDLDNVAKPILDLLSTHQVIKDDSFVYVLHCAWVENGEGMLVLVDDV